MGVVWKLLAEPANFSIWSDAQVDRVVPDGPAQAGQRVAGHARGLGINWPVQIEVRGVDAAHKTLDLTTALPFGITVDNHITVTPLNGGACQVSFG